MALAALILTIAFAVLTVGVRAAIQARRTGATGIHRFDGGANSPEGWASLALAVSFVLLGLGPLLGVTGLLDPVAILDSPALRAIGLVLGCVGALLVFGAQLAMGDSWRVGVEEEDRTALVTAGIFAIVRNPIYTVTFVAVAGFALMVPNPVELLGFVLIVVAYELLVRWVEEPFLLQIHGDSYRAYAARVGRFVPGLGLMRPPRSAAEPRRLSDAP